MSLIPLHDFTRTERLFVRLLMDGENHSRQEIMKAGKDTERDWDTCYIHLMSIREKLKEHKLDLVCICQSKVLYYRIMAPLSSLEE